jgi:phosphoribosylformimino-5-aminoimidazole carboxamide ribotide isomerase
MAVTRPFEILPAIDLRGGRVVRLRQGDFAQETAYSDDPAGVAAAFADAGAAWLHVVDLDAARTGEPVNRAAVGAILAAAGDRVLVELAGGLRNPAAVANALSSGAARVIVGTAALGDPAFAGDLVRTHGSGRIAVALDVRDGRAVGQGWVANASSVDGVDVEVAMDRLAAVGVEIFEVTAIDRDGLLGGPDFELYRRLLAHGRGAIIASAGIASVDDLQRLREIGCAGAIVGRAIYDGRLTLAEALSA